MLNLHELINDAQIRRFLTFIAILISCMLVGFFLGSFISSFLKKSIKRQILRIKEVEVSFVPINKIQKNVKNVEKVLLSLEDYQETKRLIYYPKVADSLIRKDKKGLSLKEKEKELFQPTEYKLPKPKLKKYEIDIKIKAIIYSDSFRGAIVNGLPLKEKEEFLYKLTDGSSIYISLYEVKKECVVLYIKSIKKRLKCLKYGKYQLSLSF